MGYTDITVVLDRSGSMQSIREDTIGGLNAFFADQKKEKGTCLVTLTQFDNEYETIFEGVELEHVADLTKETFVPRGGTALLDAMGRTINATKARIDDLDEDKRPEKVIFIIITDGHENASREFTDRKQIFDLVTERTEKDDWHFIYLGANQDAIAVGCSLGVPISSSISYDASAGGTRAMYANVSRSVRTRRRGASLEKCAFTDNERKTSMQK